MGWISDRDSSTGGMSEELLEDLEAQNERRFQDLLRRGVQVQGIDTERLRVAVESLMTPTQRQLFRSRWADRLAELLGHIEEAAGRATLLRPSPGPPVNGR